MSLRVVHYINQFFAQIGGEEMAHIPAERHDGEVKGPGAAFKAAFKDEAEIISTIVCGDSYFNENLEEAKAMIDAGATRLGVSAGVAIMEGLTSNDSY